MKGQDKWETSNSERRLQGVLRGFLVIKDEWHAIFWGADGKVSVSDSLWSSFSAEITLFCHTPVSEMHLVSVPAASNQSLTVVVWACNGSRGYEHKLHLEVGRSKLMGQSWVTEDVVFMFFSPLLRCELVLKDSLRFPDGHQDFVVLFTLWAERQHRIEWDKVEGGYS